MENLKIGLLLHFYQPWWQFEATLQKIVDQCYRPILRLVDEISGFCFTANINLSLLELLQKHGYDDVITGFQNAVKTGKIELMHSTAQHPITPLIPEFLQKAQIERDKENKRNIFDLDASCPAIYLPEMAFSRDDINLFQQLDFKWTVIDDKIFADRYSWVPFDQVVVDNGFKVYMRSSKWSNMISWDHPSFEEFRARIEYEVLPWTKGSPAYMILAMDAETFGHHPGDMFERFLRSMLQQWAGNRITPLDDLGKIFPPVVNGPVPKSSWSTEISDHRRGDPYPLWNSQINKYHDLLWRLVNTALEHFDKGEEEDCLKITSSCHWWWISGRPWWNPSFMKKGANKAIEIIRRHGSGEEPEGAEKIYQELKELY